MGIDIASANYQQEPIDIKDGFILHLRPERLPTDANGNLLYSYQKLYRHSGYR